MAPEIERTGWTSRGTGLKVPESNLIVVPFSISIVIDGVDVGFIDRLDYTTRRRADRIRHLSMHDAGRVIAQVPFPEDMSLAASGFGLYNSTLIGRITGQATGIPSEVLFALYHTLNAQVYPFDIELNGKHPTSGTEFVVTYGECWLTDFGKPVNITNSSIVETVTIQPSWTETEQIGGGKEVEGSVIPELGGG